MAALHGVGASVAPVDSFLAALMNTSGSTMEWNIAFEAAPGDVTAFADATKKFVPSVRGWTATLRGHVLPALAGVVGVVTFASGYVVGARGWSLHLECDVGETTAFSPTGNWRTYLPGLISWSGGYEALLDGTTLVDANAGWLGGAAASATFAMNGTFTYAGSIIITGANANVPNTDVEKFPVTFQGSSTLTPAGSGNVLGTSAIAKPVINSVVFNLDSTREFTGNAFWKTIDIECPFDGPVTTAVTLQGTGACTET